MGKFLKVTNIPVISVMYKTKYLVSTSSLAWDKQPYQQGANSFKALAISNTCKGFLL